MAITERIDLNKIMGKVIVKESSVGVPNVIVTAYDIDLGTNTEEDFGNITIDPGADFWKKFKNADRLGSIVTDQNGLFSLDYEDNVFSSASGERRPDLLLVVTAPEQLGSEPCPTILHYSCGIRQNAGRVENYVIWIPYQSLIKAGIQVIDPSSPKVEEPSEILKKMEVTHSREKEIEIGTKNIVAKRIASKQEIRNNVKGKVDEFLNSISAPPTDPLNKYAGVYVQPGENVEILTGQMISKTVDNISNALTLEKYVSVGEDQIAALKDSNGNFRTNIPAEEVDYVLSRPKNQKDQMLLRINPINMCRPQKFPYKTCFSDSGNSEGSTGSTEENDTLTNEDLPKYTNKLIRSITPPEKGVVFDFNGNAESGIDKQASSRAGEKDVQTGIDQFQLNHGPADTGSIYDFHHVQIALEHVWNQLMDDRIPDRGTTLYSKWAQLGLDVTDLKLGNAGAWSQFTTGAVVEPDANVVEFFDLSPSQWLILNETLRNRLREISDDIKYNTSLLEKANLVQTSDVTKILGIQDFFNELKPLVKNSYPDTLTLRDAYVDHLNEMIASDRSRGEKILKYADKLLKTGEDPLNDINNLIGELNKILNENYLFTVYAANNTGRSINYGLDVVYRQEWQPVNYQVGKLIKTIPLAPKEIRKFSKKVSIKKSKSLKEVENNLQTRKTESSETYRAETEIVLNSTNTTNFNLTTQGNFNYEIGSGSVTNAFTKASAITSNDVKKDFHEAILKSSEEYKNEHNMEINSSESVEHEFEESGEISNPNDEITVTYLFYELQRRYRVREQIHKVIPIIFVAQEVPKPNEIDNDWIVSNDWILNRALLDDSYRPALSYISTKITGDEFALKQMAENLEQQRKLVDEIKDELISVQQQVGRRYNALEDSINRRADALTSGDSNIVVRAEKSTLGFSPAGMIGQLFGGDDSKDAAVEAAKMREEAAKDAYERSEREQKDVQDRLQREVTALNAITEKYTKAASEHLNRKAMISRLLVHIKENILYYMQAIWNHEPPDQRFFRLHKVRVPKLSGKIIYSNIEEDPSSVPLYPYWDRVPLKVDVQCRIDPIDPQGPSDQFQTLAEVADLDNLLGYKGNYMIFPLTQANVLTDFMLEPYRDPHTILRDPDESGNWTLDQFEEYVCCVKKNLNGHDFNKLKQSIEKKYDSLVNSSAVQDEEIIIPSGSLFIEALPGKHPLLEDFKLVHRAIDVKKVQAETRKAELENIRLAGRLVHEEYEDPDIEKKIVIEGDSQGTIVTPDDS